MVLPQFVLRAAWSSFAWGGGSMTDIQDYRYGEELVPESASRDVPVNPYSLLEAVNDASEVAHTSWLIFLGVMAYLTVAVAGVSHKDLLLNVPLMLPVLGVEIELTRFFLFAPFVLLFMHFGLLVQHVMLARKVLEFDQALRPLEATDRRTHPLRLELHSYFFTQAIAGPERSRLFSAFLHAMIWATVVILPVLMMLYIQVVFLPYHDIDITWSHRIALVAEALLLLAIGIFLKRTETKYWAAFWRSARYSPLQFAISGALFIAMLLFSFFVATVPDEAIDRAMRSMPGFSVQRVAVAGTEGPSRDIFSLTALLFEGHWDPKTARYASLFQRNLVVTDLDLVSNKDEVQGEVTVSLRDRDLRLAKLDRSDLHGADFTGANLEQATLVGADLRGAKFSCADPEQARTAERDALEGCARLADAVLDRANLSGADLTFANLSGASFEEANLQRSNLAYAQAIGTNFTSADLTNADLSTKADFSGANFLSAKMHGVNLNNAYLFVTNLSSAELQGSHFRFALAVGANFKNAEIDAGSLRDARLYGADLGSISARGVDFSQAQIWNSRLPGKDAKLELADFSQIKLKPPTERDLQSIETAISGLFDLEVKKRLQAAAAPLTNLVDSEGWGGSEDFAAWKALQGRGSAAGTPAFSAALTRFLVDTSCLVRWSDGGVASGVVLRALTPGFKGDAPTIFQRLGSSRCPAKVSVSAALMQRLAVSVEGRQPAVELAGDSAAGALAADKPVSPDLPQPTEASVP